MTTEQQIEKIQEQIKNAKIAMYNSSRMNRASGVFKAKRELDNLYRQLDSLRKNPR